MKLLLVGCSDIARRRVLPGAAAAGFTRVDVASRRGTPDVAPAGLERCFLRYDEAIAQSDADLVYVSTTNDLHADLAMLALELGRHVAVDKPAALDPARVEAMAAVAASRGVALAEANVWALHEQIDVVRRVFDDAGDAPRMVDATFTMPPLSAGNFRYQRALGGGALWDLGPYAASAGRVFFGAEPTSVRGACFAADADVDLSFGVLAAYPGGRSLTGQFGYQSAYANRLELRGDRVRAQLERVFSPPSTYEAVVTVDVAGQRRQVDVAATCTFRRFFERVSRAMHGDGREALRDEVIADHRVLAQLRQAVVRTRRA